ncbi:MAG: ABC transporter permease subunit [Pseudomonadota bacterium]
MTEAMQSPAPAGPTRNLALGVAAVAVVIVAFLGPAWLRVVPDWLVWPISDLVGDGLTWFAREAQLAGMAVQDITRGLAAVVNEPIELTVVVLSEGLFSGRGLNRVQSVPPLPWCAVVGATMIVAWRLGGRQLCLTVAVGLGFLVIFGLWAHAMITLASVLVSIALTTIIGLAIGIWSYRSARAEAVVRAVMNVMQTVPIFAYLIPTLLLFGYGPAAALLATVAYALPPMVHNTVLALKGVPQELVECGHVAGCTPRQLLWQVQLPAAVGGIAVGLNQAIMMTLNMVIIASMIGAGGLGFDVLQALRKLDIGAGLEAGLGIVALAVVLDRLSQAWARRAAEGRRRLAGQRPLWLMALGCILIATLAAQAIEPLQTWPEGWTISTASFWNGLVSWMNQVLYDSLEAFRAFVLLEIMRPLRDALAVMPWAMAVGLLGIAAFAIGGGRNAAFCVGMALFVVVTGFWEPAMNSVYLMIISVALALIIGFPVGFWLASRPGLRRTADLALDTLQTLPTLVYLLPAVMLFRIGDVSAVIAIFFYAVAPAIRYAMIGLGQAPLARLEAAAIAGCKPWQVMLYIRLPAAVPTLLLGVNQTIMMAFSMLVIAALVGTKDLGQQVLIALNRSIVGQGIVAGLCVAALALIADALLKAAARRAGTKVDAS